MVNKNDRRLFYGWWVVGAGFIALFMGMGIVAYVRSVFFKAMVTDLGWPRGSLALAMSIGTIFSATAQPFIGSWVDRHGPKRLMLVSAFLNGVVLMLFSLVRELWNVFLIVSLSSLTVVGFTGLPVQIMVSKWFVKKRGRAMGIALAGIGLGGFVLSPVASFLIPVIGWRYAWIVFGLLVWLIVLPVVLAFVKRRPEDIGLLPDGYSPAVDNIEKPSVSKIGVIPLRQKGLRELLRLLPFWILIIVNITVLFPEVGILMHVFALFTDQGIIETAAGTMVGLIGLFSLVGKIILGYLCDHIPVRYVFVGTMVVEIIAIFLLLNGSLWAIWLFVILFGFSMGGLVGIRPLLIMSTFKTEGIGRVMGLIMMCSFITAGLAASPVMGYIYDTLASYHLGLFICIGGLVLGAGLVLLIKPVLTTT